MQKMIEDPRAKGSRIVTRRTWVEEKGVPQIVQDYVQRGYPLAHYEAMARLVEEKLESLLEKGGVAKCKLTRRAKDPKSLKEKLIIRNRDRQEDYKDFQEIKKDIADLAGVRIILYMPTQEDNQKVKEVIQKEWGPGIVPKIYPVQSNVTEAQPSLSAELAGDTETVKTPQYRPLHLGYRTVHYCVPMREDDTTERYSYMEGDQVEIQVVPALSHAWAEVKHDIMYKSVNNGSASMEGKRILDALNGVVQSGDLLLQQFQEMYGERTQTFAHQGQLVSFLRDCFDVQLGDPELPVAQLPRDEGALMLFKFLEIEKLNTPLHVRSALTQLGYPCEHLNQEILIARSFVPPVRPAPDMSVVVCIIRHLLREKRYEAPSEPRKSSDMCSIMISALTMLQSALGSPAAARDYLQCIDMGIKQYESTEFLLSSPKRQLILEGTFDQLGPIVEPLQSSWSFFRNQASTNNSFCGFLFRLAEMGCMGEVRLDQLLIGTLSRSSTLEDDDAGDDELSSNQSFTSQNRNPNVLADVAESSEQVTDGQISKLPISHINPEPDFQPGAIAEKRDDSQSDSSGSYYGSRRGVYDVRELERRGLGKRVHIQLPPLNMLSHASRSSYMGAEERVTQNTLPTTLSPSQSVQDERMAASAPTYEPELTSWKKPAFTSPAPRTNAGGGYVHGFIQLIARNTDMRNMGPSEIVRICNILPFYMTAYAQKIGHMAERSGSSHPEIPFIHEHLHKIARRLEDAEWSETSSVNEDPDAKNPHPVAAVDAEARAREWIDALGDISTFEASDPVDDHQEEVIGDYSDLDATPGLALHEIDFQTVSDAPAFKWLISMIKREQSLDQAGLARMRKFSDAVLHALPQELVISQRRAQLYRVRYVLEWDLLSFLNNQRYDRPVTRVIEAVIVLVGSLGEAQATTCGEYLKQTWPTTGSVVLELLNAVVKNDRAECVLPDHTQLSASINGTKFTFDTYGTRYAVSEVSEQLSWLSGALRSSDDNSKAALGISFLKYVNSTYDTSHMEPIHTFSIDTSLEVFDPSLFSRPGNCWYTMFRNPVLVLNFPIPLRSEEQFGLEMPLSMMTSLLDTNAVHEFNRSLFIKGFSAMLYPTKTSEQTITWHHDFNASGEYISYADSTAKPLEDLDVDSVRSMRHIVGWSKEVQNCAGSSEAIYDWVGRSRLQEPPTYARIERFSVSGGKYVTASMNIAVGLRDKPLQIVGDAYYNRVTELRRRFVILWDISNNRGWLVQGTHALLHLVRTSLAIFKGDQELAHHFLYGSEGYPELQSKETPANTLLDERNRLLKLHYAGTDMKYDMEGSAEVMPKGSATYFSVEHLVIELLDRLEKMDAYQVLAAREDGHTITGSSVHLDFMQGWDFYKTARRDRLIKRLESTIPSHGKGWPKLARSIEATILFGSNFGEVIRPATGTISCIHWSTLPKNHYHLAITLRDMRRIIEEHDGNETAIPTKLTSDIILDSPSEPFQGSCCCMRRPKDANSSFLKRLFSPRERQPTYCDPSQGLLGPNSRKVCAFNADVFSIYTEGAIVLRHDRSDTFDPKKISVRMRQTIHDQSTPAHVVKDHVIVSSASSSTQQSQALQSFATRLTLTNSNSAAHPSTDTQATSVEPTIANSDQMTQYANGTPAIDVGTVCGQSMRVSSSESFYSCHSKHSQ